MLVFFQLHIISSLSLTNISITIILSKTNQQFSKHINPCPGRTSSWLVFLKTPHPIFIKHPNIHPPVMLSNIRQQVRKDAQSVDRAATRRCARADRVVRALPHWLLFRRTLTTFTFCYAALSNLHLFGLSLKFELTTFTLSGFKHAFC